MTSTLTLEGDVNAADTRVLLTGQGSVAAPSLVIPRGFNKITGIYATVASDFAAAGACNYLVRLGGNAVLNGEQNIVIAGSGAQDNQAGGDGNGGGTILFKLTDADIQVTESDTISVAGEVLGSDLGDSAFALTLVFGTG